MRTEHDTMGEVWIPDDAYYGPQTQRAVENFPISGRRIPAELVHAIGLVKWGAATVNISFGLLKKSDGTLLTSEQADALLAAALEVYKGEFDDEFPIDVFQTGSGTSSNMNANEVIANRAIEILGGDRFGGKKTIHPNDHVNFGQSTNDTFPTAIHVAVAVLIRQKLVPALKSCIVALLKKTEDWSEILKIGRTHLVDATPMTLGQEIGGLARMLELALDRAEKAIEPILELPVGGTAVGTGINTHPLFGAKVAELIASETGIPFREAEDHFEANAQRDGLVATHALLKSVAVSLLNVANSIRFLSSGPRCGIFEISIPDLQPGSSIMPGKVNPVLCESLMQAAVKVIGNDATVTTAGSVGGQFQLNIMMPLLADVVIESTKLLASASEIFAEKCLQKMEANEDHCRSMIEKSLAIATGLNTYIGYEKAAKIAKEAFASGKTVREVCEDENVLPMDELHNALDPWRMIHPRKNDS